MFASAQSGSLRATLRSWAAELAPFPHRWRRAARVAFVTAIGAGVMAALQIDNPLGLTLLVSFALPEFAFSLAAGVVFLIAAAAIQLLTLATVGATVDSPVVHVCVFIAFAGVSTYLIYGVPRLGRLWLWIQIPAVTAFYMVLFDRRTLGWDNAQMFGGIAIAVGLLWLFNNVIWPMPAVSVLTASLQSTLARSRRRLSLSIAIFLGDVSPDHDRTVASKLAYHLSLLHPATRNAISVRQPAELLAAVMVAERIHNEIDRLCVTACAHATALDQPRAATYATGAPQAETLLETDPPHGAEAVHGRDAFHEEETSRRAAYGASYSYAAAHAAASFQSSAAHQESSLSDDRERRDLLEVAAALDRALVEYVIVLDRSNEADDSKLADLLELFRTHIARLHQGDVVSQARSPGGAMSETPSLGNAVGVTSDSVSESHSLSEVAQHLIAISELLKIDAAELPRQSAIQPSSKSSEELSSAMLLQPHPEAPIEWAGRHRRLALPRRSFTQPTFPLNKFLVRFCARHTVAMTIAFIAGLFDNNQAIHAALWLLMIGGPPSHGATVKKFTMRAIGASGALIFAALATIVLAPNFTTLSPYLTAIFIGVLLMTYVGEGGGQLSYLAIGATAFVIAFSSPGPRLDIVGSMWTIWGISLGMIIRAVVSMVSIERPNRTLAEEIERPLNALVKLVPVASDGLTGCGISEDAAPAIDEAAAGNAAEVVGREKEATVLDEEVRDEEAAVGRDEMNRAEMAIGEGAVTEMLRDEVVANELEVMAGIEEMLGVAADAQLQGASAGIDARNLVDALDTMRRLAFALGNLSRAELAADSSDDRGRLVRDGFDCAVRMKLDSWLASIRGQLQPGQLTEAPLRTMVSSASATTPDLNGPLESLSVSDSGINLAAREHVAELIRTLERQFAIVSLS
jgi:hypothetical protein